MVFRALRGGILPVLAALLYSCGSGSNGSSHEYPDGSAWNPPAGMLPDADDAVFGRLWVNPNPVVFGTLHENPATEAMVDIINIGSEDVLIDSVSLSGDPEIQYSAQDLDSRFPNELGGDDRCGGVIRTGFGLLFDPQEDYAAQATVTVHTSDPTSPTFDVPVHVDRSVVFGELALEPYAFSFPVVKPNPVRLEASTRRQDLELCLSVVGAGSQLRITRLEVAGEGLSIGEVMDHQGNAAPIPTPTDQEQPAYPSKAVVTYQPTSGQALNGALLVGFEDLTGSAKSLVVPILVR